MDQYLPSNADEYIDCVRKLAALIYKAMEETEPVSEFDKSEALQSLAGGVETIAGLRGDINIYDAGRPNGLEKYQKELYQIENSLRDKLISLGYKYPQQSAKIKNKPSRRWWRIFTFKWTR